MKLVACVECREQFSLQDETHAMLKRSGQTFHCPWGHKQYFTKGESEFDKMRRERDRLRQQVAERDDAVASALAEAQHQKARANGYKGQARKLGKRAAAGTCPCCNRTFTNMAQHMAKQHPEFKEEHSGRRNAGDKPS